MVFPVCPGPGRAASPLEPQSLASPSMSADDAVSSQAVELLIVGGESDPNTRRVADQAAIRGVDFAIADTDLAESEAIHWSFDDPSILIGGQRFEPQSLFLRHNVFQNQPSAGAGYIHHVMREYALAWPEIRILNRRVLGHMNSKSSNLARARRMGFAVPASQVMTATASLPDRFDIDASIAKPLLGGAHTQHAAAFIAGRGANPGPPQFLQQRLDGHNVRVFVVGGHTFAFHIDSEELDYRDETSNVVHTIDTPAEVADRCIAMAEEIGFDYCAFDFRGVDGFEELYFLEVNSFPMFVRFDMECQNRLVDRMLSVLLKREIFEPN